MIENQTIDHQAVFGPPTKTSVLGIGVSRTNYRESTEYIIKCAKNQEICTVAATNVHSITTGYLDRDFGDILRQFTLVTPDGQPIRWALNWLRKPTEEILVDRVRGPKLMLDVCEQAEKEQISIFLYGSTNIVLDKLQLELKKRFPNLIIAGVISPPFRALTPEEQNHYIQQIRESKARIVFVSLGCPRQEKWAFNYRQELHCPILCVGAAFDFHAGNIPEAPDWMQKIGLEWLYRLYKEPKRLWQRYVLLNPVYLVLLFLQLVGLLKFDDKSI